MTRARGFLPAMLLLATSSACVELRTIRHQAPRPDRQEALFANRFVRPADEPFVFHRAVPERTDLDTITVRGADGQDTDWATYMDRGRVLAFLVIRNDTILYERYRLGYTDTTRSGSYSAAKAFTSALLGIALGRGEVRSLDDPVSSYVPEFTSNRAYDGVTIRHALEMQSGMEYRRASGSIWSDIRSHDARFYYTTDLRGTLLDMSRAESPGGGWHYRDSDTQIIAWVLSSATSRPLAEQLEQRVWRRIGTEHLASWSLDRAGGMEKAATGVNATARDYARFARLYLHGGSWNGEQIIPAEWVERSTTLDTTRTRPEVRTWWQMQHRTLWWVPMRDWAQHRDFYADGAKGQRIYVHAQSRTIIVQLADSDFHDFPFRRITEYLRDRDPPATATAGTGP